MWTFVDFISWVSSIVDWFLPPKGVSQRRWFFTYPLIIALPLGILAFAMWIVEG